MLRTQGRVDGANETVAAGARGRLVGLHEGDPVTRVNIFISFRYAITMDTLDRASINRLTPE